MTTSPISWQGGPQRLMREATAGGLTAMVFYAEYIGMGVVLGGALTSAAGPAGAQIGGAMVAGAVLVNCLLALKLRRPLLAGPRAASLAVLVAGMKFSAGHAVDSDAAMALAMAALAVMLTVAAAVQLAGTLPRVRAWLSCTSVALRKGFVFSTAVGIVVGAGSAQLDGCLRVSPAGTCMALALSVAAALGWSRLCRGVPGSVPSPLGAALAPFSLLIGVGVACAGYALLVAPHASAELCGVIGGTDALTAVSAPFWTSPEALRTVAFSLPLWAWPMLALLGALLGLVLLLEGLTMLRESCDQTPPAQWAGHLKNCALANLLCAPLGLACSSMAITRTNTLIECGARSQWAVLFHGLALVGIVMFLRDWMAMLPHLAVAAVLLLLAIQMIDEDTREQVWRAGYSRHAAPASVRAAWTFWCVLAVSMVCGSALHHLGWGFGGGPLIALFAGTAWTGRRFMMQRRALARSRYRQLCAASAEGSAG